MPCILITPEHYWKKVSSSGSSGSGSSKSSDISEQCVEMWASEGVVLETEALTKGLCGYKKQRAERKETAQTWHYNETIG